MRILVCLAQVLSLQGCAVSPGIIDQQKQEAKALSQVHKAEKKVYRTGELLKTAKAAVVVAVATKAKADVELKGAQDNLKEVIGVE